MKKYDRFIIEFFEYLRKQPIYIRTGQAFMSFLFEFDPYNYNKITVSEEYNVDCFYRNDLIYKNRHLPRKEIMQMVSKKFGKILDYGHISKIISLEKKRRENK